MPNDITNAGRHFPAIGLDLDGTIDESLNFFQWLSHSWRGMVYIITYRSNRSKTEEDLYKYGIRYDQLILVSSFKQKAAIIQREGIEIYFDDQDEMTADIPENVTVFKIRNGGNFDFTDRKWLYSDQTGRSI